MRRVTRAALADGRAASPSRPATGCRSPCGAGAWPPLTYEMPVSSAQIKSAILLAGLAGERRGRAPGAARPLARPHRAAAPRLRLPGGRDRRLDPVRPDRPARAVRAPGPRRSLVGRVPGRRGGAGGSGRAPHRGRGRQSDADRVPRACSSGWARRSRWRTSPSTSASPWPIWSCGRRGSAPRRSRPGEIPGLIDEIPLLAVLAARAEGTTVFRQVGELRVKESDRLGLIAENLRSVGVPGRGVG